MKLLDLPADIINILPKYFDSIYDLYNVLLTCRTLYAAYRDTETRLPPILPKLDGQPLFQPYPHLLVSGVARQIGDWAVSSASNRYDLYQNLLNGYDGLLSLAERVTLVSLSDLRHLHETQYTLLNPLTRLVDFEVGPAMVRHQDMDPSEYGLTICQYPDLAVLNHVVYCELFHLYVDEILASSEEGSAEDASMKSSPKAIEAGIRHRFMAYCLPDRNNHRHQDYASLGKEGQDHEWQLLDYIQLSASSAISRRNDALKRYWDTGVLEAFPEDETPGLQGHEWDWTPTTAEKREHLFITVADHLGWLSLRMLLLDGLSNSDVKRKLKEIRTKIRAIPNELVDKWQFWDHNNDLVSEVPLHAHSYRWFEWLGLATDCHEGISTSQESSEDLQAEQDACESLLKLAMSAEKLGIAEEPITEHANH